MTFGVIWDAPRSRLVSLRYLMATYPSRKPIEVGALAIDPVAIRQRLRRPPSRWPGAPLPLVALGALGLALAVGLLYRRRAVRLVGTGSLLSDGDGAVEPTATPTGAAPVDAPRLELPEAERRLLALLLDAQSAGRPFVPVDQIEAALWPGHANPDYVRKMRNQTLRRLADRLIPLRTGEGDPIVRRQAPEDRRRLEYALGAVGPLDTLAAANARSPPGPTDPA
jgi:hypothetical protein